MTTWPPAQETAAAAAAAAGTVMVLLLLPATAAGVLRLLFVVAVAGEPQRLMLAWDGCLTSICNIIHLHKVRASCVCACVFLSVV